MGRQPRVQSTRRDRRVVVYVRYNLALIQDIKGTHFLKLGPLNEEDKTAVEFQKSHPGYTFFVAWALLLGSRLSILP